MRQLVSDVGLNLVDLSVWLSCELCTVRVKHLTTTIGGLKAMIHNSQAKLEAKIKTILDRQEEMKPQ